MDAQAVETVRRFNRTVTQRVGALRSDYLARARPLGASRVLWEIGTPGEAGRDVRTLREQLDLDSGYLSRVLRSLERAGLVEVRADRADRRVRRAYLTGRGEAERSVLDHDSDALAWSVLEPLPVEQRDRLLDAMRTVDRLLTAGQVELAVEDPNTPDARYCLDAYYAELDRRFDGGFDPGTSLPADVPEFTAPAGLLVMARLHGVAVGCGGLKLHGRAPAEVKRVWVADEVRGMGVGRRLLARLEQEAYARGARRTRLDTNRSLTEAIALYRSTGYVEVPAFNREPYAHHWFEKALPAPKRTTRKR
jgi:DNA-binding MarR family transcriptional regulator/GNAT superfamily N-acetyltransferase